MKKCLDCNTPISYKATRCRSCFSKTRIGHKVTTETRSKISKTLTGRKLSPDHYAKTITALRKLHKRSPSKETKHKLSIVAKNREQERIRKAIETDATSGRTFPIGTVRKHGIYMEEKVTYDKGKRNWRAQHRIIMERQLGRRLERLEHIHHINGDTLDNRLENLVLISAKDHRKLNAILYFANNCDDRIAKVILDTVLIRFPHLYPTISESGVLSGR